MAESILSFLSRRRFRPTIVPTVATMIMIVATVSLGNWQRHRAEEKDALREVYERAVEAEPAIVTGSVDQAEALRYRPVRVSGRFDAARQILIDNKIRDGRPGYDVVTPLRIENADRSVLVDRGWVALGKSRATLPSVPPPEGLVTVRGRANLPPRYFELGNGVANGPVWPNLDIPRVAAATGIMLMPFLVEQTAPISPQDVLLRDWPAPDFGTDRHVSYMMQWYAMAALAMVLWLTLNWRVAES